MISKKTTISDIAKITGYSKTTVSFAFNSPSRISKEACEKILKAAKELDYMPDPVARNFSLGSHKTIGFLLPQRIDDALSNPYTQAVLRGIGVVAEKNANTLMIIPPMHSSIAAAIKNATVDGLISMGLWFDNDIKESLRLRKLPLVLIDGADEEGLINLSIDDKNAAKLEMKEVLSRGHRKIAIVSLPFAAYSESTPEEARTIVRRRQDGYIEALREYDIDIKDIPLYSCPVTYDDGIAMAEKILNDFKPTCIVCMSDIVAYGIIAKVNKLGYRVPEDISVIGFDGIKLGLFGADLTTIVQAGDEKGKRSAELLFSLLAGNEVQTSNKIEYHFHEGKTLKSVKD